MNQIMQAARGFELDGQSPSLIEQPSKGVRVARRARDHIVHGLAYFRFAISPIQREKILRRLMTLLFESFHRKGAN